MPLKSLIKNENENALALGLTDALITRLGSLRQIAVRPTSAVLKFADSDEDAAAIGQKLNVDVVLAGTIQENNQRLRLNLQLVRVADGRQIWAQNFDQPTGDIFSLQDAVSTRVAQNLVFELQQTELATIIEHSTQNEGAYEKYLRARFYATQNNKPGFTKAIELYEQAIDLDPNFAEAHAGLADVYVLLYNFGYLPANKTLPQARQSINRALEINPKVSRVYPTLALIQFLYDLDWPAAEKSLQKAIEINPNQAYVYLRYGFFLTLVGRFDEALIKLEKARELDPLSPIVQTNIANVYYSQKRYPEAIEKLEKVVVENPEFPLAFYDLGDSYHQQGDAEKCFAAYLETMRLDGNTALADKIETARRLRGNQAGYHTWLSEITKQRQKEHVQATAFATVYVMLKDREQTINWLETALAEHDPLITLIKSDPKYDFIREDRRFQALLQKLNF